MISVAPHQLLLEVVHQVPWFDEKMGHSGILPGRCLAAHLMLPIGELCIYFDILGNAKSGRFFHKVNETVVIVGDWLF